jgi:acetyltransferase/esterase
MSVLEVPGGRLYSESHGDGPLLVLIPGAGGTADVFRPLMQQLASDHTVLCYDRRGFSRSSFTGPPPQGADRLQSDADDVRRLVEHLGGRPATVFGASSGALVALAALANHPEAVGTVVAFEPPAVRLLPDGDRWVAFFADVYDVAGRDGLEAGLAAFRDRTFPPVDRALMARAPRNDTNLAFWFGHELRQYPALDLDLDALAPLSGRIVPAVGRDSAGYPCARATDELGRRLGRPVVDLPGGHVGFIARPEAFAGALRPVLATPPTPSPLLAVEARIAVADPVRYVMHLCRHAEQIQGRGGQMPHTGPDASATPTVTLVERSESAGTIQFDQGRCRLTADGRRLTVRIEAADESRLQLLRRIVQADLERFGTRDGLTVTWQAPPSLRDHE